MEIEDPIKTTIEEIGKVLNIKNVIGDVIETDDKALIPVTKMGMGFGAGGGEGKGSESRGGGMGAGAGGAAGIEPIAMVVVFKSVPGPDGIRVLTLSSCSMAQALGEISSAAVNMMKEMGVKAKDEKSMDK